MEGLAYNQGVASKHKRLIIIPGSCSHKSNWFDQLGYFRALGYQLSFLDLHADKYRTFAACADRLFQSLAKVMNANEQPVIVAHSMGAMLLLKVLSESKYYRSINQDLYERIRLSKIIFLQMPLNMHNKIYFVLNLVKYWIAPLQLVHSLLFRDLLAWLIVQPKKILLMLRRFRAIEPLAKILDFVLNQLLILNAFVGTRPWEFFNLVRYYRQFGEFTTQGFFASEAINDFQRAMDRIPRNKFDDFDKTNCTNYYFSYGDPDYFCEVEATHKFANFLGSKLVYMPFSMHNPQHMFWCQDKLHELIAEL